MPDFAMQLSATAAADSAVCVCTGNRLSRAGDSGLRLTRQGCSEASGAGHASTSRRVSTTSAATLLWPLFKGGMHEETTFTASPRLPWRLAPARPWPRSSW